MRVIVIDVGNTSTGIGLYIDGKVHEAAHIKGGIRMSPVLCAEALRKLASGGVEGAVIGSVVPLVNERWKNFVRRELGMDLLVVNASLPMNITVDYCEPEKIGADRLADACGGVKRYGAPLVVADFGTALTFDVIMPDKSYIGGVITPGLPLMTDYLCERTALLPHVELKGECPQVGRSTEEAMRIGAEVGYRGIVREIVNYLRKSMQVDFKLVATGGYAAWALRGMDMEFVIDEELTLFGLGCIFERVKREEKREKF
ncbi:MAG: type III pantothenate kinase [Kiritimatiellae bacterium]|nr:type III pantothenate kinase [Kiritimatiellia bacterium]